MPSKPSPFRLEPAGRRVIEALASPIRQELVIAFGGRPATVRELAARTGRTRQALYYHLGQLERAGLVVVEGWQGTGPDRERIYRLARTSIGLGARRTSVAERKAATRAVDAMLRLTAREVRAIAVAPELTTDQSLRPIAIRGKGRLDSKQLARVNELIAEAIEVFRSATRSASDGRLYALTIVLTPAREAPATTTRKKP
jgi:DNA-binding transcriptional ArsR family regulator